MPAGSRLISWGRHYQTGARQLDREHEELIQLLNALYTQWQNRFPRAVLVDSLDALVQAVCEHFQSEERFMAQRRYAELLPHKAEHDAFAAEIHGFQSDFRRGEGELNEALFQHLAAWLRNHLLVSDKPMGQSLSRAR